MMMESAPGLVNWNAVNKLRRPGVHKLACLQAVACGSDFVQYFQWRKGRGFYEQFHGAVVELYPILAPVRKPQLYEPLNYIVQNLKVIFKSLAATAGIVYNDPGTA